MDEVPVIDLAEALKRTMGDADFLKAMLDEFHEVIPGFLSRLENACQQRDMTSMGKDAHQLKGAAANLGAKAIAAEAYVMEKIGNAGDSEDCHQALENLKNAVEDFNRRLAEIDWAEANRDSFAPD